MSKSLVRISAFVFKEFADLIRQPRLIFGLIISPFLILLLVGLGYHENPPVFNARFILPESSSLRQFTTTEVNSITPQLVLEGVDSELDQALSLLRAGRLDLVVSVPDDPAQTLRENQQATVTFYFNEIDPQLTGYMPFFARIFIDEMNRRLVEGTAKQEQSSSSSIAARVKEARDSTVALRAALDNLDRGATIANQQKLTGQLSALDLLLAGLSGAQGSVVPDLGAQRAQVQSIQPTTDPAQIKQWDQQLAQLQTDLNDVEQQLQTFQQTSPSVLLSPLSSETKNVARLSPSTTDYFVGPVIALLVQHLAVTFAALSIVDDRRLGVLELIRVSPLSNLELMTGKFLSHFILNSLIVLVLTTLVAVVLGTPMIGRWIDFALVLAVMIFTSTAIGFVLSLLSETDSQAVQYSMVVLLASVFFSGFFLELSALRLPIQLISWSLPATYGILELHNVMLRGQPPSAILLLALAGIGLALFLIALFLLRRRMNEL
ncbi:MAG: ABC transporter permease [Anaerolineales bacterium]|jgi:ABC-2 type transport system permease protein